MKTKFLKIFDQFCAAATQITGAPAAFLIALLVIIVWAISGPIFHFSEKWELTINSATTIVTFLMVFIIQQSQNKHTTALQLKLNELIAANKFASNRLVSIEDLTAGELQTLKEFYVNLARLTEEGKKDLFSSHSLDEKTNKTDKKPSDKEGNQPAK